MASRTGYQHRSQSTTMCLSLASCLKPASETECWSVATVQNFDIFLERWQSIICCSFEKQSSSLLIEVIYFYGKQIIIKIIMDKRYDKPKFLVFQIQNV